MLIDYERMQRLQPRDDSKIPFTMVNVISVIIITLGILFLYKRYKDKEWKTKNPFAEG
jgi:hypothetical protein